MKMFPFPKQIKGEHNNFLQIPNVQIQDTGTYVCHGTFDINDKILAIGTIRLFGKYNYVTVIFSLF